MRRLICLTALTMLLALLTGCSQTPEKRYQRYLDSLADSTGMEFVTPAADTVVVEEATDDDFLGGDDDGLVALPDIPQERGVNMGASDYELKKVMMGQE